MGWRWISIVLYNDSLQVLHGGDEGSWHLWTSSPARGGVGWGRHDVCFWTYTLFGDVLAPLPRLCTVAFIRGWLPTHSCIVVLDLVVDSSPRKLNLDASELKATEDPIG
jgi:hypothetical protein